MVRPSDFSDPEYDRRLAEFKAMKAKMQMAKGGVGSNQTERAKPSSGTSTSSSLRDKQENKPNFKRY